MLKMPKIWTMCLATLLACSFEKSELAGPPNSKNDASVIDGKSSPAFADAPMGGSSGAGGGAGTGGAVEAGVAWDVRPFGGTGGSDPFGSDGPRELLDAAIRDAVGGPETDSTPDVPVGGSGGFDASPEMAGGSRAGITGSNTGGTIGTGGITGTGGNTTITGWINRTPSPLPLSWPEVRSEHAMAYDVARNKVVMYGGWRGSGNYRLDETWEWDGTAGTWTNRTPSPRPSTWPLATVGSAIAYDGHGGVFMFGGFASGLAWLNGAWEWKGATGTWTNLTPASIPALWPASRAWYGMAYDSGRDTVMIAGGSSSNSSSVRDIWDWNGALDAWTNRTPATIPPSWPAARGGYGLTFDAGRGKIVLFGGVTPDGGLLQDTWEWNGTDGTWTNRTPSTLPLSWPQAREVTAMAYDPRTGRVVLFGGDIGRSGGVLATLQDTWEWDGAAGTWTNCTPSPLPASWPESRSAHAMAYDGERVMLFGGGDYVTLRYPTSQTWEWGGCSGKISTPDAGIADAGLGDTPSSIEVSTGAGGSGGTGGVGGSVSSGAGGAAGAGGATSSAGVSGTSGGSTVADGAIDSVIIGTDGSTENHFVVSVDGRSVTDSNTGLVWQRDGSGPRPNCANSPRCTQAEAKAYCSGLNLGVSGWALPTLGQLESLVDKDVTSGASIDLTAFPDTPAEAFWTSTPYLGPFPPGVSGSAWYAVFFSGGGLVSYGMGNSFRVRCVR